MYIQLVYYIPLLERDVQCFEYFRNNSSTRHKDVKAFGNVKLGWNGSKPLETSRKVAANRSPEEDMNRGTKTTW